MMGADTSGQHQQRRPQELAQVTHVGYVGAPSDVFDRSPSLAFAKAHSAQRRKDFLVSVDISRRHAPSVYGAVRVPKGQASGNASFNEERPSMRSTMVAAAQHTEFVWIIVATFGTKMDVVNIYKRSLPTAGHDAAATVSPHYLSSDPWRYVLLGARRGI